MGIIVRPVLSVSGTTPTHRAACSVPSPARPALSTKHQPQRQSHSATSASQLTTSMQVTHNATNAHPIVYHALTVLGVLDVLVDTLW